MTPREKECKTCDNNTCRCRFCRGKDEHLRVQCGCCFSEDTECSWNKPLRYSPSKGYYSPDEEDIN